MKLVVHPLTEARWSDLETVFAARGAYPVDKAHPSASDTPWFGSKAMFDEAGFEEVARRKPARPVVRLRLG